MSPQEREKAIKGIQEMKDVFRGDAAKLLEAEVIKPPPREAIALLRKDFNDLLDAVAESKQMWHELGARAEEAAERVRQSEMKEIQARIRDGESVDEQAESI